jgi:type II secretory pathway pseudopilin PulG
MGEKTVEIRSLITLPVALGVIVIVGGVSALFVSGLLVYQARSAKAEAVRLQAVLQASREAAMASEKANQQFVSDTRPSWTTAQLNGQDGFPLDSIDSPLKPGTRVRAQRPAHWDDVEIIDVLENSKIKVRWLSGTPGEAVIASDLVRSDQPPTN